MLVLLIFFFRLRSLFETVDEESSKKRRKSSCLTRDDVLMLCHLFYLPYEYGGNGNHLLKEFGWLKENGINDIENPTQFQVRWK